MPWVAWGGPGTPPDPPLATGPSWFDVNQSTFEENIRRKCFYVFVPSDLKF